MGKGNSGKPIRLIIQETEEVIDFGDFVNEIMHFEEPFKKEPEK